MSEPAVQLRAEGCASRYFLESGLDMCEITGQHCKPCWSGGQLRDRQDARFYASRVKLLEEQADVVQAEREREGKYLTALEVFVKLLTPELLEAGAVALDYYAADYESARSKERIAKVREDALRLRTVRDALDALGQEAK